MAGARPPHGTPGDGRRVSASRAGPTFLHPCPDDDLSRAEHASETWRGRQPLAGRAHGPHADGPTFTHTVRHGLPQRRPAYLKGPLGRAPLRDPEAVASAPSFQPLGVSPGLSACHHLVPAPRESPNTVEATDSAESRGDESPRLGGSLKPDVPSPCCASRVGRAPPPARTQSKAAWGQVPVKPRPPLPGPKLECRLAHLGVWLSWSRPVSGPQASAGEKGSPAARAISPVTDQGGAASGLPGDSCAARGGRPKDLGSHLPQTTRKTLCGELGILVSGEECATYSR